MKGPLRLLNLVSYITQESLLSGLASGGLLASGQTSPGSTVFPGQCLGTGGGGRGWVWAGPPTPRLTPPVSVLKNWLFPSLCPQHSTHIFSCLCHTVLFFFFYIQPSNNELLKCRICNFAFESFVSVTQISTQEVPVDIEN